MAPGLAGMPGARTQSPTTRRPSWCTSPVSIRVRASDVPRASMMTDTICRDSHNPQGCSGGNTAMICRNVVMLSRAAERDRSDPRVGTDSVMRMSQHKMGTFVNGNVQCVARSAKRYRGLFSRAAQHLRAWDVLSTAAGGAHVNVVGRWWRQGDHFDWLTLYLNTHGIRLVWRAKM